MMINKIYSRLPISIQNFVVSAYGYKWKKRRFGGIFNKELIKFRERDFFSNTQWVEYQEIHLSKLLSHAYDSVPYYRKTLGAIGFLKPDMENFKMENLNKLPFLEKNDLRLFGKSSLISELKEAGGEFYSSSGTTGTPTSILFSKKMHQRWSAAFEARIRNWAGLSINNPRGMIGGRRVVMGSKSKFPLYRYNSIEKQVYFSAYHISPHTTKNYLQGIQKHKVDYMTGYAVSNFTLAKFIKNAGLKAPKLKAVITSSEKLTKEMRDTFLEVYGCKTFDSYSGVEACGLISECENGKLHVSPDVGIIEIIKEDGSAAKPGEVGEAICTGLLNFDQPLIRYRIGDLLKLSDDQTCQCGRNMPVIEEIIGRIEDVIIGKDGREMVRFHGLYIDLPNIVEGQVIQHSINEFELMIVASVALSNKEKEILLLRMQSQLGDITLKITELDQIPRSENGKVKAVISYVTENK
jgi:phenylacetate-CoA ligase